MNETVQGFSPTEDLITERGLRAFIWHHVSEGLRPGVACGEGLVGTISRQNQVSHRDRHRLGWGDGSVGKAFAFQASGICV